MTFHSKHYGTAELEPQRMTVKIQGKTVESFVIQKMVDQNQLDFYVVFTAILTASTVAFGTRI